MKNMKEMKQEASAKALNLAKSEVEAIQHTGSIMVNAYYDHQQTRIASNSRVRDVIRRRVEGIPFEQQEEKKEDKKYDSKYTDDKLAGLWNDLLKQGKITKKEHDYVLTCWNINKEAQKFEDLYEERMGDYVKDERLWNDFLSKIRGIGIVIGANVIKEFGDCSQYATVSKLWANTGNAVVDGTAPRRRKGVPLRYNPKLRTLAWKISESLLTHNKGIYRQVYDTDKEKQLNKEYEPGYLYEVYGKPYKEEDVKLTLAHANNRAKRKMRKIFLDHLWHAARTFAGLPATKTYVGDVLGHVNIITWEQALRVEAEVAAKLKEESDRKKAAKKAAIARAKEEAKTAKEIGHSKGWEKEEKKRLKKTKSN